jgi:hypothetical protein
MPNEKYHNEIDILYKQKFDAFEEIRKKYNDEYVDSVKKMFEDHPTWSKTDYAGEMRYYETRRDNLLAVFQNAAERKFNISLEEINNKYSS